MHARYGIEIQKHVHVAGLDTILAVWRPGARWGGIGVDGGSVRMVERLWEVDWKMVFGWWWDLGRCTSWERLILCCFAVAAMWCANWEGVGPAHDWRC